MIEILKKLINGWDVEMVACSEAEYSEFVSAIKTNFSPQQYEIRNRNSDRRTQIIVGRYDDMAIYSRKNGYQIPKLWAEQQR